ncbi:MAG: hypothetical protein M3Q07_08230 [Pseudobdellovibrionaceae bacterium]|uniref:hypothetical protein n=1 Tax=Oligoflexus sp. TaxID=1971216 RepID=UPI0027C8ED50|nr:hypothetical protein [Oligoflexus sp.]MDQ3231791.1 hypothetical protein [Pseudobdellovibrionaceae bacterium]HYX33881.1 hypothetical protein [Oligoflexus sp.]
MKFALTGFCSLSLLLSMTTMASAHPEAIRQEALLGLRVGSKGITYYVYSGGCTVKNDFQVYTLESYPPQLQLTRLKADNCKVLVPDGEEIFFTWDEVGLQKGMPFKVLNPLQAFVVPE